MGKIAVIGSINMDVINRVHAHPAPGETVHGIATEYAAGGKGANQAVGAAKAGGDVTMIGAVGMDGFGEQLKRSLREFGVDTRTVEAKEGTSGLAFITVDDQGENSIILSSGANGKMTPADVEAGWTLIGGASTVLLQNEIPWKSTLRAMELAGKEGARVVWNPAPAIQVTEDVLCKVALIVVNESEARLMTGVSVGSMEAAAEAARRLTASGAGIALVTLGAHGSVWLRSGGEPIFTPAFAVRAVDTTAAGDTFVGALAASLEEGLSDEDALRFAAAASAIGVTRAGAQQSIPIKAEVEAFLKNRSSNLEQGKEY